MLLGRVRRPVNSLCSGQQVTFNGLTICIAERILVAFKESTPQLNRSVVSSMDLSDGAQLACKMIALIADLICGRSRRGASAVLLSYRLSIVSENISYARPRWTVPLLLFGNFCFELGSVTHMSLEIWANEGELSLHRFNNDARA